jgi:VIT1/CCC1 family predicted Fe2+/Mn2+ transporter
MQERRAAEEPARRSFRCRLKIGSFFAATTVKSKSFADSGETLRSAGGGTQSGLMRHVYVPKGMSLEEARKVAGI